jgi:N-acetylglutamate synthase-like GNAT family acetyltransferase
MIRRALIDDCSKIAEIIVFSWRYNYNDFISMNYLYNVLTVKAQENRFANKINDDKNEIYVFEEDSIIKGFVIIGDCRDDDIDKKTKELQAIYIDPIFQRQNIGTKLLNYCVENSKKKEKKEIIVWVFSKNKNAQEFYKNIGFNQDNKEKALDPFDETIIRLRKKI